jgi:hypothetical protein
VDSEGRKFGKSVGGAIWLSAEKPSPYKFYQYLFQVGVGTHAPGGGALPYIGHLYLPPYHIAPTRVGSRHLTTTSRPRPLLLCVSVYVFYLPFPRPRVGIKCSFFGYTS